MAVAITGMHRSGTSMIAKALRGAGLYLGEDADLKRPAADNEDGFWEHASFVAVNDELISTLGGGWDRPPDVTAWAAKVDAVERVRASAELLVAPFRERPFWGWKDPRTSITLPFWESLLGSLTVVVCLRNPLEVALSLHRRNSFSYPLAMALWLEYNRRLVATTAPENRIVTHYDLYFHDPRPEVERLLGAAGLPWSEEAVTRALDARVDRLRHTRFTFADLVEAQVSADVVELYAALCEEAGWRDGSRVPPRPARGLAQGSHEHGAARWLNEAAVERTVLLEARDLHAGQVSRLWTEAGHAAEELRARDATIESLRSDLEEQAAHAERLTQLLGGRDATIVQLQASLQEAVEERDATIRSLQDALAELEKHSANVSDAVLSRDELLSSLQAEIDAGAAERERLEEARAGADALAAELRERLAASEAGALDVRADVGALRAELAEARTRERALEEERLGRARTTSDLQYEVSRLLDQLATARAAASEREGELAEAHAALERDRGEVEQLQGRTAALEQELAGAALRHEAAVAELEARLAEASGEAARSLAQAARRSDAIADLQARLTAEARRADAASERLRRQTHELERATEMLGRRDETIRELEAAEADVSERLEETLVAWRADLRGAARDATEERRRLEGELHEAQFSLAAAQAVVARLSAERDAFRRRAVEAEGCAGRLAEVEGALAAKQAELSSAHAIVDDLRGQLEARSVTLSEALLHRALAALESQAEPQPAVPARPPAAAVPSTNGAAPATDYAALRARIHAIAAAELPPGARVAVVSRGDDDLLAAVGSAAMHYPQTEDGRYAGYHPADSGAAINHFESLIACGAQFALFPATAFWWFDHYEGLREYLERRHHLLWSDETCRVYQLGHGGPQPGAAPTGNGVDVVCFPVIDWSFRFQRPQQLAAQLAHAGHRIFYLRTTFQQASPDALVEEIADDVFTVHLPGPSGLSLYQEELPASVSDSLLDALDRLRREWKIGDAIALVDLPFWTPVALAARKRWGWHVVYDCMDHHAGFSTTKARSLECEEQLIVESDLVLAASQALYELVAPKAKRALLLPNAAEFEHFASAPPARELAHLPRPIVGYYGAISDWFDVDLIRKAALARRDWSFVLIGDTFGADVEQLRSLENVHLLGEQPYERIPSFLHAFDVACIPFLLTPLTHATNPVKFYEYLSAGKPVVAVDLPELRPYPSLYEQVADADELVRAVERSLAANTPERVAARVEFGRANSWEHRHETLSAALAPFYPKATIVVISFDNPEYLELCLESVWENTLYPNYDVIVVDNGSSERVIDYLRRERAREPRLRLILNEENLGFARGNNLALEAAADAEYVFLLNDDTVVTRGWLGKLIRYLQDDGIGLVGPVTNWSGNESRIEVPYTSIEEMPAFAERYMREHRGQSFDIGMLPMYCVGMRRAVLDKVGYLNERFEVGMFEDDDFSLRIRKNWYRVVCAEDVFVHHWGRASFGRLDEDVYEQVFERNRKAFEELWGTKWEPHRSR